MAILIYLCRQYCNTLKDMETKFFNTAGPIKPEIHYNIDSLTRVNTDEIMVLIKQEKRTFPRTYCDTHYES